MYAGPLKLLYLEVFYFSKYSHELLHHPGVSLQVLNNDQLICPLLLGLHHRVPGLVEEPPLGHLDQGQPSVGTLQAGEMRHWTNCSNTNPNLS